VGGRNEIRFSPDPVRPGYPWCRASSQPQKVRFAPDSALERNEFELPVPRQMGNGFEASSKWGRSTVGPTVSSEQLPASRQTDRVVGRRSEKRHSPSESGGVTTGRAVGAASASLRLDRRFESAFL
jgi:hypothetical protein